MRKPPGIRFTLTPRWMSVAHALASDLDAQLILGVNLEANSRRLADAEARALIARVGHPAIDAFEIGNEPELYGSFGWYRTASGQEIPGRPHGYDEADFIHEFQSFSHSLPRAPVAGPSSGSLTWLAELGTFLRDDPRVDLATIHAYPLKHCGTTPVTTSELLSDQSSHGLAQELEPFVRAAYAHHLPTRVDEINGVSCGGQRGVSDAFSSALWALDTLFELAKIGVRGVNIQTVPEHDQRSARRELLQAEMACPRASRVLRADDVRAGRAARVLASTAYGHSSGRRQGVGDQGEQRDKSTWS